MKQFLKSPWTIGLGTTLFGFGLTLLYDLFKQRDVLSTILLLLNCVPKVIIAILTYEVKIWCLSIIIILLILIHYFYKFRKGKTKEYKPKFLDYTEDRLKEWKWSWSWGKDYYEDKWFVEKLTPHCPKCDTYMQDVFMGAQYKCPRCGFDSLHSRYKESEHEIEALINDNIRRKFYSNDSQ